MFKHNAIPPARRALTAENGARLEDPMDLSQGLHRGEPYKMSAGKSRHGDDQFTV